MAKTAKTVREMRDYVLKRMNALGSSDYEDIAIDLLNDAVADVSAMHDWEYLRAKGTVTFGASTPEGDLPADCDRVLSLHKSGADYHLAKVEPLEFEQTVENSSVVAPVVWCVQGFSQALDTSAPFIKIRVHTAPSSGDVYTLWYIKLLDEILGDTSDIDDVPNIPLHIWNMIGSKSILEGLMLLEAPNVNIQNAERHFANLLQQAKRREKYGSSKYGSINKSAAVQNHYATRMSR